MTNLAVRRLRKSFGKMGEVAPIPNLIQVQKNSYEDFLQFNVPKKNRVDMGLQNVLQSIFPITDFSGKAQLEFMGYEFDKPKYDIDECRQRGATYAAPLRIRLRLVIWDTDEETGAKSVKEVREQEVYIGDMPLMTDDGTFVINGTERVVVSQMHRSPGVFFDHDDGKTHVSGKLLFGARIIPYRGSWMDIEFDAKDLLYVRIDRRRKILASTLLMALEGKGYEPHVVQADDKKNKKKAAIAPGMSREEILETFYEVLSVTHVTKGWQLPLKPESLKGLTPEQDIVDAKSGAILVAAGKKVTPLMVRKLKESGPHAIIIPSADLVGKHVARTVVDPSSGEVIVEVGGEITKEMAARIEKLALKEIFILQIDNINVGPYMLHTLAVDKNKSREDALLDIYRILRPGEPPTVDGAMTLFHGLFFDSERYDLSAVGRVKMNARLGFAVEDKPGVLRKEDIVEVMKIVLGLKDGQGEIDDIDHLGNRRVRSVGELLENQYRVGLLRMERTVRERMSSVEMETAMPHDLINAKPASATIREFFTSSQLSQFMDQTNPLSEITHKRRLSALGPGGLTRDRASFEVRDVHPTHYGRICPIETPEGPNIGLINSLATYARINQYGFIESPYRRVVKSKITDEIIYLSAIEEGRYTVAASDTPADKDGKIIPEYVNCRAKGDYIVAPSSQVDFIDVSPKQLVSVAASLIPFLENDDANRALMGSNMQRQAVPLIKTEAPLIGTGMESNVARDSGTALVARRSGVVDQVDAERIVIRVEGKTPKDQGVDIYNLKKFQRSNQNTCINQKPLVEMGDVVEVGDVIADGPSTDKGELALGRNVLVGFMSWKGFNFEDSIMISERVVSDDVFTSIHIEEFEVMARDTKLGSEEITRDILNVGEDALRNLDETGIVYIGADVNPGDILVGKVTPKGETLATPEEKLLRAIFGEKASDVKDSSLRLPPGVSGTVVDVRVFSRRGIEKDERALAIEKSEIDRLVKDREAEQTILERSFFGRLRAILKSHVVVKGSKSLKAGDILIPKVLDELSNTQLRQITVEDAIVMESIEAISKDFDGNIKIIKQRFEDKAEKVRSGDEMSPGVLKMVKVFVAVKRKLQPGDKMAGRHGNKGVISRITPMEDMPYLEDGTPLDIILNPLGIPSRMNVGQILETHLGWAAAGLAKQIGQVVAAVQSGDKKIQDLRKKLKDVYDNDDVSQKAIDDLSDEGVLDIAKDLKVGIHMSTPVFDGATVDDVAYQLEKAGLDPIGQVVLIDGQTGIPFERKVTVGYKYMLKLHHLVDEKIHARSIGPYSLVTQQPLGGKAQFGGQRFGEMEVWALEAYGAAYTLQEMLTVKSDDVSGRTRAYEAIIRGDDSFESGIPESFNVLTKEMKSLGLNVELK